MVKEANGKLICYFLIILLRHQQKPIVSLDHFLMNIFFPAGLSGMAHGGNPAFLFFDTTSIQPPGNMVIKGEGTGSRFFIYQWQRASRLSSKLN